MNKSKKYGVIVVGAGPAGSSASLVLARGRANVLLIDKNTFPRDKSCGDGLTRTSTKAIYKLGLLEKFQDYLRIRGIKIKVKEEGEKVFPYPMNLAEPNYGLTVPRMVLDQYLLEAAIESGAEFRSQACFTKLIYDEEKVNGIELSTGEKIYADIVIGADGALSKIAYEAQLASTSKNKIGFGIRGYYDCISNLSNQLEIYLPIMDGSYKRILPSYGWVFPMGNGTANIGVGLFEKTGTDNIKDIMNQFVKTLKSTDARFRDMSLNGKLFGAPMRFDFNPSKSFKSGLLLVGDAAGMISPFTGEGIGTAIESGIEAAQVYLKRCENKDADFVNLEEYGHILAQKYQGYFETGMESVRRYHLSWNILKHTFNNDKPLFKILRTASVFPEGLGESFFENCFSDVRVCVGPYYGKLKRDLLEVSKSLIDITRPHWPFIAKIFNASDVTPGIPFRPSLFMLLSGYHGDLSNPTLLTDMALAFEVGFIANMCHDSVEAESPSNLNKNWGNILAILVGDYLFSEAYRIMSCHDPKYIQIFSEIIEKSNEGQILMDTLPLEKRILAKEEDSVMEYIYQKNSATFELCFLIGSRIGKRSLKDTEVLKGFGKHFGAVFTMGELLKKIMAPPSNNKIESNVSIDFTNANVFSSEEISNFDDMTKQKIKHIYQDNIILELDKALNTLDKLHDCELKNILFKFCQHLNDEYEIEHTHFYFEFT